MNNQLKRILPLEVNFELKNLPHYFRRSGERLPGQDGERRVFFCDSASYNNLGDQAIALAMAVFIKDTVGADRYVEITEKYFLESLSSLKKTVTPDDVLCLSGGGNMGDLYPRFEAIRRKVIRAFPQNQIIIFPQTIDYRADAYGRRELKRSAAVYNSHKALLVCAREKQSFLAMSRLYHNVRLVPDIVFYLCGKFCIQAEPSPRIGMCLRGDRESVVSEEMRSSLSAAAKRLGYDCVKLSTMAQEGAVIVDEADRSAHIAAKLREFKACQCIVTDRLHGMIFSIMAGVPCLILDNSNHKVFGVYETVRPYVQGVYKLERAADVGGKLSQALQSTVSFDRSKLDYSPLMQLLSTGRTGKGETAI